MKRLFPAIITLLVLLTVSCGRNKGMFILHGTVLDGTDSILVVGLDNRFENADTIFCTGGQFTWKFRPDTVTTLVLILPDGRHHPVFAEKNVESFITIPADTGLFSVSGGSCNDAYQSFYLASAADTTLDLITARIDSFITADPFSEVTPYLIYARSAFTDFLISITFLFCVAKPLTRLSHSSSFLTSKRECFDSTSSRRNKNPY